MDDITINQDLLYLLKRIFDELFENDLEIIKNDIQEETISHRLAFYIENNFNFWEYQIDCEYNRFKKDIKEFNNSRQYLDNKVVIKNKYWNENKYWYLTEINSNNFYLILTEDEKVLIWEKISSKEIRIKTKKFNSSKIRPDIIIHRRWLNDNLYVFELKKNNLIDEDIIKLKWLTNSNLNFWYKYWVWLHNFNWNEKSVKIDIYKDWNKIEEYKYQNWELIKM